MDIAPSSPGARESREPDRFEAQLADALQACVGGDGAASPETPTRRLVVDGQAKTVLRACVRDYVAALRDAGAPPELAISKLKSILNEHIPKISDHTPLAAALVTAGIETYYETPPASDGR